jgi:lipoyl(octanoyl) transferase
VLLYKKLGLIAYSAALEIQKELVEKRLSGEIGDTILLLEHSPVITQGKRECAEDFLSSEEELRTAGIEVVRVDRGGRLTYHGPGQLIGYFICDVTAYGGVKEFVRLIEDVLIGVCADAGIEAGRNDNHPGVWVGHDKIAAVGLHVTRGISSHGIALNVSCDLGAYKHIVPCGIQGAGVTSMKGCGADTDMRSVEDSFIRNVENVLGASYTNAKPASFSNKPGSS